jgi:hypothetical protein
MATDTTLGAARGTAVPGSNRAVEAGLDALDTAAVPGARRSVGGVLVRSVLRRWSSWPRWSVSGRRSTWRR